MDVVLSNDPMEPSLKRSPWRRPGRLIAIFLIAFIGVSFLIFRLQSVSGAKREIEAIRSRGLPVSAIDLEAWYKPVPREKNAALAFTEAMGYVDSTVFAQPTNELFVGKGLVDPLDPQLAEEVALFIGRNAEALDLLHAAAKLPESRYPIDLTKGPATLLPHLANVKQSSRLLKWDAILHSSRGDPEQAMRSLNTGFALVRSLRDEPLLISELVRIASLSILLQGVERVINEQRLGEPDLVALSEALRQCSEDGRKAMWRAIVGERAGGISIFELSAQQLDQLSAVGAGSSPDTLEEIFMVTLFRLRQATGMQDRDLAFYLGKLNEFEAALNLDYPKMLATARDVDDVIQTEVKEHPIRFLVSRMLLPNLASAVKKEALLEARLRCAKFAIAIERFRLQKEGALPSAHELVPAFLPHYPRDPFDDQPLLYEKLHQGGYRITSAAATADLTRGTSKSSSKSNRLEIAFTLLR